MRRLTTCFLLVIACGDSQPALTDGGTRDGGPVVQDGAPTPIVCDSLRDGDGADEVLEGDLEIGEYRDGAFVPYAAGDAVTLVFGFQGGVMITPVVRFASTLATSGECVQVEVRHLEDPENPGRLGELSSFTSYTERVYVAEVAGTTEVETSALQDQVGWSPFDARFVLDVTVRGASFARHVALPLQLGTESACDDLVETPCPGCCYRRYAGEAVVDAVGEVGPGCDDTTTVTYHFDASRDDAACFAAESVAPASDTLTMSRGCLETYAIAVGSRFDHTWRLIANGSCSPFLPEASLPLEGCPCE
ncbi:MAG: hypothetical protein H6723_09135 [Sandaracinus sp.]|nr:hypothetical protein [Sandaracinus sp.]